MKRNRIIINTMNQYLADHGEFAVDINDFDDQIWILARPEDAVVYYEYTIFTDTGRVYCEMLRNPVNEEGMRDWYKLEYASGLIEEALKINEE